MAEIIRRFVQDGCKNFSDDQKEVLLSLAEIQEEAKELGLTPETAMEESVELQRELRRERKKKGRR